jgi:hypothetical protein
VIPPLPREIEADPAIALVRARLEDATVRLWSGGSGVVPRLALGGELAAALADARRRGELVVGLDGAEAALDAEARGLLALATRGVGTSSARVSRLLLVAEDGAERFYRRVERLTRRHAPRLLTCWVTVPAVGLGAVVLERDVPVKAVLVLRKRGVAAVLRALVTAA